MKCPHHRQADSTASSSPNRAQRRGRRARQADHSRYSVEDLVERATFEEVCGLMWKARGRRSSERRAIAAVLEDARAYAFDMLPSIGTALDSADSMEALRTAVGHLRAGDFVEDRARLTGAIAVFAAAWARTTPGSAASATSGRAVARRRHSADAVGDTPDPARVRGLDAYLCCVVDHGMNASTFTARVVASTGSDLVSAVVAAIGALKGPLHGGAPGPVLDMLDAIGQPDRARSWLEQEIAAGRRIMGMGHRIYRVRDPRAAALESATARLERTGVAADRLAIARARRT